MTNSSDATALVALVGSRIAHDLASPIGAIANGVELLGLSGHDDSPEFALITESVENARARIKLFRIAFGAAQPDQSVPPDEIAALIAPAGDGRSLAVDWPLAGPISRPEAKLVLLALMCLETAMPWGGPVSVRSSGGSWRIEAQAERTGIAPELWDHLSGTAPAPERLAAAQVHFLLLPAEAEAQGRSLHVTHDDTSISIAL